IFLSLGVSRIELDDRFPVDFRSLHDVVTGHEVDHLSAQYVREGFDHLLFVIHLAAVANESAQAHTASFSKLDDTLADVVGCVHGHHFTGNHDVDLLGLAFTNGHGEATANDVSQDVVEGVIELLALCVGAELFQQINGGYDAASRAAHAWFGPARFYADDAVETRLTDVLQVHVFTLGPQCVEHRLLGEAPEQ